MYIYIHDVVSHKYIFD